METERKKPLATILGPSGNIRPGPLEADEGILYADICLDDVIMSKYRIDIAGDYNRPDPFAHHFKRFFTKI